MNDFDLKIKETHPEGLLSEDISTLQVNLGRHCNLSCRHCHLECSPQRREQMPDSVMEAVISLAEKGIFRLIDITGGSPELHPGFRFFLEKLCGKGFAVQVRTNLTNFLNPEMKDMVPLLKKHQLALVGSLPCYLDENVDAQRGLGVYGKSIVALKLLNRSGYGIEEGLILNLVFNPGGPNLPPSQAELESIYRQELHERFGISFSHLLVLANMPLGRFRKRLEMDEAMNDYMRMLQDAFNPATIQHLMCRHQISIDWDGSIYDCDFNLALGMPVNHGAPQRIETFDFSQLRKRQVTTGNHCFGCTAGTGSSCSGALADFSCCS